ncbi:hypothetical protein [Rhizohabitans arisaemae]|uniref:hypothetical protein n=1 Tax=Rhizohabitans arisaemae TaxID=2720610 RepID=UPI0024B07E0D|nr:hypothetical protein [Rhizohabitans arisaemae]
MSGQPACEEDPQDPLVILHDLPKRERPEFLRQYRTAVDAALFLTTEVVIAEKPDKHKTRLAAWSSERYRLAIAVIGMKDLITGPRERDPRSTVTVRFRRSA